jgi:hypothetical protein
MKRNQFFRLGAFVLSTCLFASCVDEKYDLDNVDMTIGTTGDLTLPTSSTDSIVLKSIMDLEDDGVVQVVDGEFYLKTEGCANVPEINISSISIARPQIGDINITVSRNDLLQARTNAPMNIDWGNVNIDDVLSKIPAMSYSYQLKENEAYYTIGNGISSSVPKEVLTIDSVVFADETTLELSISVEMGNASSILNKIHLDNLRLTMPKGLHVAKAEFVHYTQSGGEPVCVEGDVDNATGLVVLTKNNAEATVIDEAIKARIIFDKAVTGEGSCFDFDAEAMKVSLSGSFYINGSFRIESSDIDLNEVKKNQELLAAVIAAGNFKALFPETVTFRGGASFLKDITVGSFAGEVQAEVGDISAIALNDMPDFLDDPEVCLDLVNPAFFVKVAMTSPLPADAKTGISLKSMYDDGSSVEKSTGEILIPGGKTEVLFCVADHMDGIKIPEEYSALAAELVHIKVDSLNKLLMKLPDEIKVDVEDIFMDIKNLFIPYDNKIKVDYMVYTPLEFGPSFKLVYQGTEEGLAEDMDGVDKVNTKGIRIEAVAETNFPLDLTLSLDVQDKNGNSLNGELVQVDDIVIMGHNGEGEFSTNPVLLELKPVEGHTIGEALERIDKLSYKAVATSAGQGKLYEDTYVKLTGMKITLIGGITYDAN